MVKDIRQMTKLDALVAIEEAMNETGHMLDSAIKNLQLVADDQPFCVSLSLDEYLRQHEIDLIKQGLRKAGGNRTVAAEEIFHIPRTTLVEKIRRYKINDLEEGAKERVEAESFRQKAIQLLDSLVKE